MGLIKQLKRAPECSGAFFYCVISVSLCSLFVVFFGVFWRCFLQRRSPKKSMFMRKNGLLKAKTALHSERRRFGGDGGNRTHLKLVFIG